MQKEHPDLYDQFYSDGAWIRTCRRTRTKLNVLLPPEALQAKIGTLSLDKQAKLEKDAAKKEKKAEAKAGAAEKKKKVCSFVCVTHNH